ncbi:MAG TPA: hypothetical protein VNJ08_13960 [Bacteriovoracaceae bacterium]|nr:hypothetical protein [Bacteriovoracaceae bacterium]
MKMNITAALSCLLLFSCGKPTKSIPETPVPQIFTTSLSATPLFLYKQVPTCKNKTKWDVNDLGLNLFLEGQTEISSRNFEGYLNENLVRNSDLKVIEASHYNEDSEYIFDNKNFQFLVHSRPRAVDLCPDTLEYRRETVESAALNASYFINQANENYIKATGAHLDPIVLKISPVIRQTIVTGTIRQTLYLTDNAYYQPELKTITFLPHSLEAKMAGYSNYWEIPMVAAHEYGHHIFNSVFGMIFPAGALGIDLCFGNHAASNIVNETSTARKVGIYDVVLAFNEGFADLVAFYTLDEADRGVKRVKCMEFSRDVSQEAFLNGTPKVINWRALNSFFATEIDSQGKTCEDVDYQDVHVIGAIFAHNADRFLSVLTPSNTQKLQVLHEWLQVLKARHAKLSSLSPEVYFEEVFEIFLRLSLKKFGKEFDRSSCNEVKRFYPELLGRFGECS